MFGAVPAARAHPAWQRKGADEMKSIRMVLNGYCLPDLGQGPQVPCPSLRGW